MNLDLDKVQKAMDWLAESSEGSQALDGLADFVEDFRTKITNGAFNDHADELNDAEMRYILERLISQRGLGNWNSRITQDDLGGFDLQGVGALFPQVTHLRNVDLPGVLRQGSRLLNRGFVIKASIPSPV
jgi:hypothetical protein